MTRHASALIIACALACPAMAEEAKWGYLGGQPPIHLNPERSLVRVTGSLVPDVGPGDDVGLGVELAAGIPIPSLDTLSAFVGHMDADNSDLTTVGLFAEETYLLDRPLMPYLAAGFGYGWADQVNATDQSGFTAEVEFGLKYRACPSATVHAGVEFNWADEDLYPSTDGLDDKQWRFVLGASWLY